MVRRLWKCWERMYRHPAHDVHATIEVMSRNVQLVKSLMYILLGTRPQPWNKPRRRHQHGRNLVGSLGLDRCGYSGATHNPEAGGLEDIRQDRIPLGAE